MKLKHGDIPDEKFDKKQLQKGIEVEYEHTDDSEIAKQIAKAHLVESPEYYIYLEKMEKQMNGGKKMVEVQEKNDFLEKAKKKYARGGKDEDSLKAKDQDMSHVFGEIDAFPTKLHIVGNVNADSAKKPAPRTNPMSGKEGKDIEVPRAEVPEVKIKR